MTYLVSSFVEGETYKLDGAYFTEQLKMQWPRVVVRFLHAPMEPYTLEWVCRMTESFEGKLSKEGDTISLDGQLEDCAQVAIWFRNLIPFEYRLLFYDLGFHAHIELEANTTQQQVEEIYLPS